MRIYIVYCLSLFCVLGCSQDIVTPAAPKVAVLQVLERDVPLYGELVGQTIGSVDIAIRARVDGQLEGIHFKEGEAVEKGQLLYTIDPKSFEAKVVGVKGEVAEAMTALTKAEADLARVAPLAKMNAVSQRDLDAAVAAKNAAEAAVETANAKLNYTEIELGYTKIESPVDGVIGITKARVGDYVGKDPNPVVLNTVSRIDPIHVRVTLSERDYLQFARRQLQQKGKALGSSKSKEPLELILADGSVHEQKGEIFAVNSQVDPTTGTLTLEASFPNPSMIIRPGQYAKIRFVRQVKKGALVVWQRAIQELQDVHQVYVVTPENKVEVKQVKVGEKVDGIWIIESGLSPTDRVIVEGFQKVRPGMTVEALTPEELGVIPPESALLSINTEHEGHAPA